MKQHGLDDKPLQITDATVLRIFREYTREPGRRNFGRRLETVIRKIAVIRSSGDEATGGAYTDIAITGEITLRKRVLAVGGIKDKVLAAHRVGIKTVMVPKQNENDLANIPDTVRDSICVIPVERIDEVLKESFIDVVLPQDMSIERIVQAERERSAAKQPSE